MKLLKRTQKNLINIIKYGFDTRKLEFLLKKKIIFNNYDQLFQKKKELIWKKDELKKRRVNHRSAR